MDGAINFSTDLETGTVQKLTTSWLFQSLGDIIELDAWVPENVISQIEELNQNPANIFKQRPSREEQLANPKMEGPKAGWEYNFTPEGWDLPESAAEVGALQYNAGDYLFPHRDKMRASQPNGDIIADSFRMICHVNHTNVNDFVFMYDGQPVKFEPRRWYAVNTRKVHSGFSFVDNVWHLSAGVHLSHCKFNGQTAEENLAFTTQYLMEKIPFFQPNWNTKGVACERN